MNDSKNLKHIYDMSLFNVDDFDVLLHEILKQARVMLSAEAGTIYIHDGDFLRFNVFQNDLLSYENIYNCYRILQNVRLPLKDIEKYLAVESFVTEKIIIIDDIYNNTDYDFIGVKEFDARFNYRTKSLITIPLIHPIERKALGVLQLLNKKNHEGYTVFDEKDKELLQMVSSFIAISVFKAQTNVEKLGRLNKRLEEANSYLEHKIKLEMSENEKKNAIIFHQSKLVSMGEMIGNIAHQWRQPLSTISTIASGLCLQMDLGKLDEEEAQEKLRHIVMTTRHLSHTIDDFRNFYKVDKSKSYFNLSRSIKKCLSILNAAIMINQINVVLHMDEKLEYYGLENEFIQAILNIISNAKDALKDELTNEEERFIFIDLYHKDQQIYLSIKDNAKGISDEILPQIFEQNFTTKEEEGGTGIGLFMTKEIIENHMKAIIKVENCEYTYNNKNYKGVKFLFVLDKEC